MNCKTRNPVFTALAATFAAVLVSFLFTCSPFGAGGFDDDGVGGDRITYTDVEYSPDGGSIKIYLDGSRPVPHSRALTLSHAILGHDFFEVAFYNPATNTVARAVWETGHAAGVNGVARGVDYASAIPTGLGAGQGAAIIFVGKKSDKTLLAVGSLTDTDDSPGTSTVVTAATRSVTFSVAAFKTGVNLNADRSSFKTDAKGPINNPASTDVLNVMIGYSSFPLFRLAGSNTPNKTVHGEYTFEVVSDNFESKYSGGIIQKSAVKLLSPPGPPSPPGPAWPTSQTKWMPRYPVGDKNGDGVSDWETSNTGFIRYDVDTATAELTSAQAGNVGGTVCGTVSNPVKFTFGPTKSVTTKPGQVFAFSFEIEVYPLTNADGRASRDSWYLRPGFDSYLYDLDDGAGLGGAILIGTGDFDETISSEIIIFKTPNKTRYNGIGGSSAWTFDLTGIVVYEQSSTGAPTVNITDSSSLYYIIGGKAVPSGSPNIESLLIANQSNGSVTVTVEYYGYSGCTPDPENDPPYTDLDADSYLEPNPAYTGGPPKTGSFTIYYIVLPPGLTGPPADDHRFIVMNDEGWRNFRNQPGGIGTNPGAWIIVFYNDCDIGDTINIPAGNTIIIIAANPNIILGRTAAANPALNDGSTGTPPGGVANTYYLGVWPFDEVLAVNGVAITSQPFYINAGGSFTSVTRDPVTGTVTAAPGSGAFISGGTNKIRYMSGVQILNPGNFGTFP